MNQNILGKSVVLLMKLAIASAIIWWGIQFIPYFNYQTKIESYMMATLYVPESATKLELFVLGVIATTPLLLIMFFVFNKYKTLLLALYFLVGFYVFTTYFGLVAASFSLEEFTNDNAGQKFDLYMRTVPMSLLVITCLFHILFVSHSPKPVLKIFPVYYLIWIYFVHVHLILVQNLGFIYFQGFEEYLQFFQEDSTQESEQDILSQASNEQWLWFYFSMGLPFIWFLLAYYSRQIFSFIELQTTRLWNTA